MATKHDYLRYDTKEELRTLSQPQIIEAVQYAGKRGLCDSKRILVKSEKLRANMKEVQSLEGEKKLNLQKTNERIKTEMVNLSVEQTCYMTFMIRFCTYLQNKNDVASYYCPSVKLVNNKLVYRGGDPRVNAAAVSCDDLDYADLSQYDCKVDKSALGKAIRGQQDVNESVAPAETVSQSTAVAVPVTEEERPRSDENSSVNALAGSRGNQQVQTRRSEAQVSGATSTETTITESQISPRPVGTRNSLAATSGSIKPAPNQVLKERVPIAQAPQVTSNERLNTQATTGTMETTEPVQPGEPVLNPTGANQSIRKTRIDSRQPVEAAGPQIALRGSGGPPVKQITSQTQIRPTSRVNDPPVTNPGRAGSRGINSQSPSIRSNTQVSPRVVNKYGYVRGGCNTGRRPEAPRYPEAVYLWEVQTLLRITLLRTL